MKKLLIVIALLILSVNFLIRLVFPSYGSFNVCLNSATIIIHTVLLLLVWRISLKDAFRISLSFIFSSISLVMFICGFFVSSQIEGNVSLIAMALTVLFEAVVLIIANAVTKKAG